MRYPIFVRNFLILSFILLVSVPAFSQEKSPEEAKKERKLRDEAYFNRHNLVKPTIAEVKCEGLKGRKLEFIPEIKFPSDEDIKIKYNVLIAADGSVVYVKADKGDLFYQEYLKGGVAALYHAKFTPLKDSKERLWVTAEFTFAGNAPVSHSGQARTTKP